MEMNLPPPPANMRSPHDDEWSRKLAQRWKDLTENHKTYRESDEKRFPMKWKHAQEWKFDRNLVIIGKSGSCKTRMGYQLIKKFIHEKRMMANVIHDALFALEVGDAAYHGKVKEKCEPFFKTPLLLIDDLGKAPSTERYITSLYAIAEERYSNGLITVITTQLSMKETEQKLASRGDVAGADAILRRFVQEALIIEL